MNNGFVLPGMQRGSSRLVIMAGAVDKSDNRKPRPRGEILSAVARRLRRPLATIGALAVLAASSVATAQLQWATTSAQVTRVVDGGAIEVKIGDRLDIARCAGIDTPDIPHPTRGPEFYRESARAANARLAAASRCSSSSTSSRAIAPDACSRTPMRGAPS
jgi:endonuclease YncB( thermonuclease family)